MLYCNGKCEGINILEERQEADHAEVERRKKLA